MSSRPVRRDRIFLPTAPSSFSSAAAETTRASRKAAPPATGRSSVGCCRQRSGKGCNLMIICQIPGKITPWPDSAALSLPGPPKGWPFIHACQKKKIRANSPADFVRKKITALPVATLPSHNEKNKIGDHDVQAESPCRRSDRPHRDRCRNVDTRLVGAASGVGLPRVGPLAQRPIRILPGLLPLAPGQVHQAKRLNQISSRIPLGVTINGQQPHAMLSLSDANRSLRPSHHPSNFVN